MPLAVTERLAGRWFVFIADTAVAVDDITALTVDENSAAHRLIVHLKSGGTVVPVAYKGSWRGGDARESAMSALDEVLLALAEIPDPATQQQPHNGQATAPPEKEMLALPTGELRPSAAALWVSRLRMRLRR